ncbi:MAG: NAD(P)-binding protein [Myxococcota bacterium]
MSERERIAVLGGGIGALSAVFALTQQPDWADRYEITVYQMGWRLGGKAASGVVSAAHGRVEEHGLHVWFGFYQNAFHMMRACYDALGRPPDHPMPTAESAFTAVHDHTFLEDGPDGWMPWSYRFTGDGTLPGAPAATGLPDSVPKLPGVWGTTHRVLSWVRILLQEHPRLTWLQRDGSWLPERPWKRGSATPLGGLALVDRLSDTLASAASRGSHRALVTGLSALRGALVRALEGPDPGVRRLRVMLDLSLTGLVGMLADRVPERGFRSIDDLDFRAWLLRHGAAPDAVDAPIVRTLYDIFFAYEDGDVDRPSVAAGATLRGMFRLLFGYHGAVLWKMNAGMGDAIIAPLYQLLERRGVRFRFFHAVEALHLDPTRRGVDAVDLRIQAVPVGSYDPLVLQRGLPCWPSTPRYEQLVDGDRLRDVELERPGHGSPLTLRRGTDFDRVLLAIPVGALGPICGELADASPRWRDMLAHLKTVRTQALQLWFTAPLEEQGVSWRSGMLASYVQPFSSWSDFSQVLDREDWPADRAPAYLAYSCGVLPEAPVGPEDSAEAAEWVHDTAVRWLEDHAGPVWPAMVGPDGFRWDRLYDPEDRVGRERLRAQYVRANTAPAERYTLSLPGTTRFRLAPGGSGFENLVLAGAWTDNHYTLSCIEGTVMSGLMAARAIDGRARRIVGEGDV